MININITVYDIVAGKNYALESSGLNLWIGIFTSSRNFSLTILKARFFSPTALTPNLATVGVTYNLESYSFTRNICDCRFSLSNSSKVVLSDVNISNIAALAFLFEEALMSSYRSHLIHLLFIDQCTVSGNNADFSRATGVLVAQQGPQTNVIIEVSNCIFQGITSTFKNKATILAQNSGMVLNNCVFFNNLNTALHITGQSSVTFEGNITFCNNSGLHGGAILFEGYQTFVFLMPNTRVQFIGNTALVTGGAIHVSSRQHNGMPCRLRSVYLLFPTNRLWFDDLMFQSQLHQPSSTSSLSGSSNKVCKQYSWKGWINNLGWVCRRLLSDFNQWCFWKMFVYLFAYFGFSCMIQCTKEKTSCKHFSDSSKKTAITATLATCQGGRYRDLGEVSAPSFGS